MTFHFICHLGQSPHDLARLWGLSCEQTNRIDAMYTVCIIEEHWNVVGTAKRGADPRVTHSDVG